MPVTLDKGVGMTIELSRETEIQLKETAQARGLSVAQYVESLVAETNLRHAQIAQFRAAIADRMASLNAGDREDGEEVMAKLIGDLVSR